MKFLKFCILRIFLLTDLLMPSDKHNSRMAGARDLIISLINIASFRDVPFHQPQLLYSACIRVLPLYPFDLPFFSSQPRKVTICGRHRMASVQDIKIDEALLMLCLAYYVELDIAKIETLWLSCIEIWGARFTSIFSVFSIMAGWIAKMLFLPILLCNGQNIAEYEAYWLIARVHNIYREGEYPTLYCPIKRHCVKVLCNI